MDLIESSETNQTISWAVGFDQLQIRWSFTEVYYFYLVLKHCFWVLGTLKELMDLREILSR